MKQRLDKHFLLNRAFVGTLLAIAVPIALQNMISFGVAVMDSVMLGSFGDVAIAAANLGGQPFSILMSFGFGLSSGGSVLIAQYWGKGDIGRIRKVMRISMQLVFLASLGITVVCLLMPEGILRIFTKDPVWAARHFKAGQCYNFRHFEYDGVAVRTTRSSHVTLERLTVYGCPGHGFFSSGGVHHLHFDHCRILPPPGTARSVSVSVDCLHVGNSQGNFIIEDCDFSGAGDDCINLHDNSSMGVRRLDDHRLLALRATQSALQFEAGSCIELRRPDLSPTGYHSLVRMVTYQPEQRTCI